MKHETTFTRQGSQVQSLYRPPLNGFRFQRLRTFFGALKKSWGQTGGLVEFDPLSTDKAIALPRVFPVLDNAQIGLDVQATDDPSLDRDDMVHGVQFAGLNRELSCAGINGTDSHSIGPRRPGAEDRSFALAHVRTDESARIGLLRAPHPLSATIRWNSPALQIDPSPQGDGSLSGQPFVLDSLPLPVERIADDEAAALSLVAHIYRKIVCLWTAHSSQILYRRSPVIHGKETHQKGTAGRRADARDAGVGVEAAWALARYREAARVETGGRIVEEARGNRDASANESIPAEAEGKIAGRHGRAAATTRRVA
jgi:hypothetical protein